MTSFVVQTVDSKYLTSLEIGSVKLNKKDKKGEAFKGNVTWTISIDQAQRTFGEFHVAPETLRVSDTEWFPSINIVFNGSSEFEAIVVGGPAIISGVKYCDEEAVRDLLPEGITEFNNILTQRFSNLWHERKAGKILNMEIF